MPGAYGLIEGGGVWGRKVSRACAQCGKVRWYRPSEVRKFCSLRCYHDSRFGTFTAPKASLICEMCGVGFTRLTSALAYSAHVYCSKPCADTAKVLDLDERFWAKVKYGDDDACWPWLGKLGTDGYGKFWVSGTSKHASRVAWELTNGPVPTETPLVLHRCDNPPCCNPAHLFLGTQEENSRDMVQKGRSTSGERHPSARLTAADVVTMRAARRAGATLRELAAAYGVSDTHVSAVCRRVLWQHLPG